MSSVTAKGVTAKMQLAKFTALLDCIRAVSKGGENSQVLSRFGTAGS
jgi:hypothetical protein